MKHPYLRDFNGVHKGQYMELTKDMKGVRSSYGLRGTIEAEMII